MSRRKLIILSRWFHKGTESKYGVLRKASSAEAIAGTSDDAMISADKLDEVLDARNGIAVAVGIVDWSRSRNFYRIWCGTIH